MKLLLPSEIAAAVKAGNAERLFVDESGKRIAKLIGVQADVGAAGDDRTVEFVISTGSLDRYNSTIAIDGWKTDNFDKNPVVLWAHDDSIPAIARAEPTRTAGGKLKSRAVFADRDTHPLADTVYRLIKGRFIAAASVGWIPLKWQYVEEEGRGFGVDYLEQELLEWSVVNIPANPECLVGARSMGIDVKPLMVWAERTLDQAGSLLIPRDELEALRKAAGAPSVSPPARRETPAPEPKLAPAAETPGTADTFTSSATALRTLFVNGVLGAEEFADRVIALATEHRAGRVLSKENADAIDAVRDCMGKAQDCMRAIAEHCTKIGEHHDKACEHLDGIIERSKKAKPDDGDDSNTEQPSGDDDDDDDDAERTMQSHKVRVLKLKSSTSPAAIVAGTSAAA